jgi:hypothetical protein
MLILILPFFLKKAEIIGKGKIRYDGLWITPEIINSKLKIIDYLRKL